MELRQLRYFIAVAEFGSFSAAARGLGVAQPSLSRHIKQLERTLQATLLTRTVRGVEMTGQGEKLFHSAQGILRQIELLPEFVSDAQSSISGRVILGLPTSVSAVLANPLLRAARTRFPQVRIHLIDLASGFLQEWLDTGRLDICVVYDPVRGSTYQIDDIMVDTLCLIGPAGAFPEGYCEIPFSRLHQYPLALPSKSHSIRQLVEKVAQDTGISLNIVMEVDSLLVSRLLVRDGLTFIISTEGAVHESISEGVLASARIVEPAVKRRVAVTTSAVRGSTRACQEVRQLVIDVSQRLVRAGIWKGEPAVPTDESSRL